MSDAADNLRPDYWTHHRQTQAEAQAAPLLQRVQATTCGRCGTEFLIGSAFCHTCGAGRNSTLAIVNGWSHLFDFVHLRDALHLSSASLVSVVVGVLCLLAAIAAGFIFRAETLVDWQAIQVWRIQWILGAIAVFLLGILLKKSA